MQPHSSSITTYFPIRNNILLSYNNATKLKKSSHFCFLRFSKNMWLNVNGNYITISTNFLEQNG